jgi:hypothetical protein
MGWFVFRHAGLDPASRDFNVSFNLDSGFRRNDVLSHSNEIYASLVVPYGHGG